MLKKFSEENLLKAHKFSYDNKELLKRDKICGCFTCLSVFSPHEIKDWIQDKEGTAVCPYCYDDSVIGESCGFPITKEFLEAMNEYWIPWKEKWWRDSRFE